MYELCMCLALGGVGGEWLRGLSLGFTRGSVGLVCVVSLEGKCGTCMCCESGLFV